MFRSCQRLFASRARLLGIVDELGPAFRFTTRVLHDGELHSDGVLEGNLYVRGGGDPSLTIEGLWKIVRELKLAGLTEVDGDLVMDSSYMASEPYIPGWDKKADIEDGPWPYPGQRFDAVVVTNYLHRPLLPTLVEAVAAGGVLIYETFAAGNERFGRPANPAFLLKPGELLDAVRGELRVNPLSDFPERFTRPGPRWLRQRQGAITETRLLSGRQLPGKELFVIRLEGVANRDAAEALVGRELLVPSSDRPRLKPGEFHLLDLVGLEVRLLPDRLDQPLRWRKPRRIFVNSMSDLFHPSVSNHFLLRVWLTMAICQQIAETMKRTNRIFQAGTQRRSVPNFIKAVELARAGKLGRLKTLHASVYWPELKNDWLPAQPTPPREEITSVRNRCSPLAASW